MKNTTVWVTSLKKEHPDHELTIMTYDLTIGMRIESDIFFLF